MEALTQALGEGTLYTLKVATVWLLVIGGLIGTVLPIVPGTVFIFMGCLAHYFFFGLEDSAIGWGGLVVIGLLMVLSLVVDWAGGAVGAKYFDASKWGVIGALTGGLLGIFFPFPGLLVGPLVGAFSFEMMFAKKEVKLAGKSTWGTLVGSVGGMIAKLIVAVSMVLWFVVDLVLG